MMRILTKRAQGHFLISLVTKVMFHQRNKASACARNCASATQMLRTNDQGWVNRCENLHRCIMQTINDHSFWHEVTFKNAPLTKGSIALFLYGFLPGMLGQLISVTYPRRTAQSFHPGPRDPKTIDRGEISKPRNVLLRKRPKGIYFSGGKNPLNDMSAGTRLLSTLRLHSLRLHSLRTTNVRTFAEEIDKTQYKIE